MQAWLSVAFFQMNACPEQFPVAASCGIKGHQGQHWDWLGKASLEDWLIEVMRCVQLHNGAASQSSKTKRLAHTWQGCDQVQ